MVWLPWAGMMAVSFFEYGYGSAAKSLREAHGWTPVPDVLVAFHSGGRWH